MNTLSTPPDDFRNQADDDRPRFLDEIYDAATDDLGDWWLDLGGVALPA